MITAAEFLAEAGRHGFDFYTGVPCSFLTPLINSVLSNNNLRYIGAASEGEAIAVAAGAWRAGRQTIVMCQNSGLGNAVNPLTSLNAPFCIPTLLITTWRGQPGLADEPQHALMGKITQQLLSLIGVEHARFPDEPALIAPAFAQAMNHMARSNLPFAFVMKKGEVQDDGLDQKSLPVFKRGEQLESSDSGKLPSRLDVLERFLALTDNGTAVVATTGKTGRELFTLADREQHLYQVGSMGGASGMALGVALNTENRVVVLDGDGAALMKLGAFATIGAYAPKNLLHILLDNGVHDSTGGQATVSAGVDFAGVALACGYRQAISCRSLSGFEQAFGELSNSHGPSLLHIKIMPGSMAKLGRPTISPDQVARRFKDFLASSARRRALPLAS